MARTCPYKVRQYPFVVSNAKVSCQRSVSEYGVDSCIAQSYIVNNGHTRVVNSCIDESYLVNGCITDQGTSEEVVKCTKEFPEAPES